MLIHPTLKYLATPLLSEIPLTLLEKFPDAIGTDIFDAIKSDPRLFDVGLLDNMYLSTFMMKLNHA